jgi:uncharacterized membrane protein YhaH (DUF805 family)
MSNEPKNSPLTNAWHGALVLCGIAVLLKIAVEVMISIWPWLVGAVVLLVVGAATVIAVRRWRDRNRW